MTGIVRSAILSFIVLCSALLSSCGDTMKDECTKHITEKILRGDSLEVAQSKLKACGFETTLDPKATQDPTKNTLYGDRRDVGSIVTERTQVIVKLDSNKKVTEVRFSAGLIAP